MGMRPELPRAGRRRDGDPSQPLRETALLFPAAWQTRDPEMDGWSLAGRGRAPCPAPLRREEAAPGTAGMIPCTPLGQGGDWDLTGASVLLW